MTVIVPQPARDDEMDYPDAKKHLYISLVKSALRIVAGLGFCAGSMMIGGVFLIVAELLGIVEELV